MKVNMNNLRRQACFAYDRLVKKLNANTKEGWRGKYVEIDAWEIEDDLNDLRQMVYAMAYCYIKDDPEFANLADEVGDYEIFNLEPEDVEEEAA